MPIPTPAPPVKRFSLVDLVDRFQRFDRSLDADDEYVKWSDVEALLLQRAQEIAELKAAVTLAMNSLTAIDRSRQAPVDEAQRRAVAELRRVIAVCLNALSGPAGGARGEADARERDAGTPQSTGALDPTCEHGVAWDVHCCGCHSGFLFDSSKCICF